MQGSPVDRVLSILSKALRLEPQHSGALVAKVMR